MENVLFIIYITTKQLYKPAGTFSGRTLLRFSFLLDLVLLPPFLLDGRSRKTPPAENITISTGRLDVRNGHFRPMQPIQPFKPVVVYRARGVLIERLTKTKQVMLGYLLAGSRGGAECKTNRITHTKPQAQGPGVNCTAISVVHSVIGMPNTSAPHSARPRGEYGRGYQQTTGMSSV